MTKIEYTKWEGVNVPVVHVRIGSLYDPDDEEITWMAILDSGSDISAFPMIAIEHLKDEPIDLDYDLIDASGKKLKGYTRYILNLGVKIDKSHDYLYQKMPISSWRWGESSEYGILGRDWMRNFNVCFFGKEESFEIEDLTTFPRVSPPSAKRGGEE